MSKIRTIADLQNRLDDERAWRVKEIHLLSSITKKQNEANKNACIRASVVMIYAHWEGFVKSCAEAYLTFVSTQGLAAKDLNYNFIALSIRKHISELNSRKLSDDTKIIEHILTKLENRAKIPTRNQIHTGSNLRSHVFEDICAVIGIEYSTYSKRSSFIDDDLVNNRNSIAHGNHNPISQSQFETIRDTTLQLMSQFKDDIANAAASEKYRNPKSPPHQLTKAT